MRMHGTGRTPRWSTFFNDRAVLNERIDMGQTSGE
jgi:hypothetical protein